MKKDIKAIKVTDVAIAIVPRSDEKTGEELWDTYLINLRDEALENVIISSKGYGQLEGRDKVTTSLRHFFEVVQRTAQKDLARFIGVTPQGLNRFLKNRQRSAD